ncbi:hypothetical protein D3C76_1168490 [compost metagenome]
MLQDAPGVEHHGTVLNLQHIAVAPMLQAAARLEQGWRVAIEGEDDVVGQVVDPGQGQHDAFLHGQVAAVAVGECVGQVGRQLAFVLEAVEQLDVTDQKVVDQVVEHFAEFVAHLVSLLWRTGNSNQCSERAPGLPAARVSASGRSGSGCRRCHRTRQW